MILTAVSDLVAQAPNIGLVSTQQFHSAPQKAVVLMAKDMKAVLQLRDPYVLEITRNHVSTKTPMPSELAQVDEIKFALPNRIFIKGMVNASGSEVVLVDSRTGSLIDSFLCYLPEISPDGRWIGFIKFYPTHGANGEDHYMLYDLSKTAIQNRPLGVNASGKVDVGIAVFPAEAGNKENDNIVADNIAPRVTSNSKMVWASNSSVLAFAATKGGILNLIELSSLENEAKVVKESRLESTSLCKGTSSADSLCPVLVSDLAFKPQNSSTIVGRMTVVGRATKQFECVGTQCR